MFENTLFKIKKVLFNLKKKRGKYTKNEIDNITNEISKIMLESDIPYSCIKVISSEIENVLLNLPYNSKETYNTVCKIIHMYFDNIFSSSYGALELDGNKTNIIGVFGTNGVGKTSFCTKIANNIRNNGKKVLCLSLDKQRPASQEQLKTLCDSNNLLFLTLDDNDVEENIKKIQEIINYNIVDVIIVDTAGINITDKKNELVISKLISSIDFDEKILAIDSTIGQNAVSIIKRFDRTLNITGFVITKTEIDQKGGVYFSIATASNKPIYYITNGEKITDIKEFNKDIVINAFFNENKLSNNDIDKESKNIKEFISNKNIKINYNELLQHLKQISEDMEKHKLKYKLQQRIALLDVKSTTETYILIKKWIAIIQSMSNRERELPNILNIDRINRIAKGSGTNINDVVMLKKKMEELNSLVA